MSVLQYTAEELIAIIRTRGGFPSDNSQGTTDADLLGYIHTEALGLYGEICSIHEDYFTAVDRLTLVPGKKYRIPHRAMFGKLRDIIGVDASKLPYTIEPLNRESFPDVQTLAGAVHPSAFYVDGMYIVLVPTLNSADGYLDVSYLFRPGELVLSTACRKITSISGGQLTLASNVPSTWSTADKFDIHSGLSGAEPKNWSIVASGVGGLGTENKVTFTATDIDGTATHRYQAEVGDWLCLEEQAALPGIPRELHPVLAQAVVCRILERKDKEAFLVSRAELTQMLSRVRSFLKMRTEGKPEQLQTYSSIFFGR